MIVDGKKMAKDIIAETAKAVTMLSCKPHGTVVTCGPNFETKKYLELKLRKAEESGVILQVLEFGVDTSTEELVEAINHITMQTDAIIVQLPLPAHIDTESVLNAIPASYDADGMHYDGMPESITSPVVGAIAEIARVHQVVFHGKKVVVVGQGRLVGKPATVFAKVCGSNVTVVTKESGNYESLKEADILILGAGVPNLVTPVMIEAGVAIFDAGTSEEGGVLVGDADPACAEKASIFTPVPGGIGPMTIAILLRNIVTLAARK